MKIYVPGFSLALLVWGMMGIPGTVTGMAETPRPNSGIGWTLDWTPNPQLPRDFRQFPNRRADGTMQTAFLVDRNGCLATRKPVMIIVDGSGPQAQFMQMPDGGYRTGIFASLGPRMADEYHVVASDKRGIGINENFRGTPAPLEYTRHATFEGRVAEVRLLLDRLLREPMVDPSRVVLVGHSEGAVVAAGAAAEDARITHLAFLSGGGPTQLFDFLIFKRKQMEKAGAAPDRIVEALQEIEADFRKIFDDPESDTKMFQGHAYRRWASFCAHPPIESLLKTRAKLFLAHGTEDSNSPMESFDLLVAEMIRHGRTDAVIHRYAGSDHGLTHPGAKDPLEDAFSDLQKWARE